MLLVVNEFLDEPADPVPAGRDDALAALDLTFGRISDITGPEADGGALAVDLGAGEGFRDEGAEDS